MRSYGATPYNKEYKRDIPSLVRGDIYMLSDVATPTVSEQHHTLLVYDGMQMENFLVSRSKIVRCHSVQHRTFPTM